MDWSNQVEIQQIWETKLIVIEYLYSTLQDQRRSRPGPLSSLTKRMVLRYLIKRWKKGLTLKGIATANSNGTPRLSHRSTCHQTKVGHKAKDRSFVVHTPLCCL